MKKYLEYKIVSLLFVKELIETRNNNMNTYELTSTNPVKEVQTPFGTLQLGHAYEDPDGKDLNEIVFSFDPDEDVYIEVRFFYTQQETSSYSSLLYKYGKLHRTFDLDAQRCIGHCVNVAVRIVPTGSSSYKHECDFNLFVNMERHTGTRGLNDAFLRMLNIKAE